MSEKLTKRVLGAMSQLKKQFEHTGEEPWMTYAKLIERMMEMDEARANIPYLMPLWKHGCNSREIAMYLIGFSAAHMTEIAAAYLQMKEEKADGLH